MRAKVGFFGFGFRGGLARFIRFGFRGALLIDRSGFIARGLFGGGLRGLLLCNRGGGGLLSFRFLPRGIGGGLFRFLLHSNGIGFGGFRLLASEFRVLAPLDFRGGLLFGGFLIRGGFGLRVFFGFLFYGHDARFFGGFHNFARRGIDGFFLALSAVDFFRVLELLFGFGQRRGGVFIGLRDACDSNGVARFEQFERSFAVDAKDGVLNFGVRRRIDAAAEQFILGINVFDFALRGRTQDIFENNHVARLRDGEIRLGRDDHAESLHVRDGFDLAAAVFKQLLRRDSRRGLAERRPTARR